MLNMIKRYYSEEQDLTAKSLKGIEDTENTDIQEFEKIMTDDRNSLDIFLKGNKNC